MEVFISHFFIILFLLLVAFVLIKWRSKSGRDKTLSMICNAQYEVLKNEINRRRTPYGVMNMACEVEKFYNDFKGRVAEERIETHYRNLNHLLQERINELDGRYSHQ